MLKKFIVGVLLVAPLVSVAAFDTNLKYGQTHPDVKALQQFLNTNGFSVAKTGLGSIGLETSFFGNATVAALQKYQEAHRKDILDPIGQKTPTGLFYPATRAHVNKRLGAVSPTVVSDMTVGTSISKFIFSRNLSRGASGADVRALQDRLSKEKFLIVESSGYFDSATESAVALFQKQNSIEQTGTVGPKTRAKLNASINPAVVTTSLSAPKQQEIPRLPSGGGGGSSPSPASTPISAPIIIPPVTAVSPGTLPLSVSPPPPPSTVSAPTPTPSPVPAPTPPPPPTPSPNPTPTSLQSGVQGLTPVNPVSAAMTGTRTFTVRTDAQCAAVPWGSLVPGDVVNIYYNATPYKCKFGMRAQGTMSSPITINGVTDASGNRPIIEGNGSRTASDSASVFSATPAYGENLGVIVIKRSVTDPYTGQKPSFITLQNLEVRAATGAYTTALGVSASLAGGSCVYVHVGADITLQNMVLTDCAFGLFVMAKDELLSQAGERITLRNSRIYGNGVNNSWFEHGVYMQAANPVIEGNYIGQNRSGSQGSSYKSRSSGEIFRNNYVVAHARALDFVHSEEQSQGIATLADYNDAYVYGNTIISQGPECIHFGGDNFGEQESGAIFTPSLEYRKQLYFWNNQCTITSGNYNTNIFDLSERVTRADVWNNTFTLNWTGAGTLSWLQWAGNLRLGSGNVINRALANARPDANSAAYSISVGNPIPTLPPRVTSVSPTPMSPQPAPNPTPTPTPTPSPAPTPTPTPSPTPTPAPTPPPPSPVAPAGETMVNFSGYSNGTNVSATGNWGGINGHEVQSGYLQSIAGRGSYGDYSFLTNVTSADQGIQIVRKGGVFSGNIITMLYAGLPTNYDQGKYIATWYTTSIDLRSANGTINYSIPINVNWANDNALKMTKSGSVVKLFLNGTEVYSYIDPTPLTGGSPGFSLAAGSVVANQRLISATAF